MFITYFHYADTFVCLTTLLPRIYPTTSTLIFLRARGCDVTAPRFRIRTQFVFECRIRISEWQKRDRTDDRTNGGKRKEIFKKENNATVGYAKKKR